MSAYYVAWCVQAPQPFPKTAFEYLVHPNSGDGGIRYFNALLEAPDERSAWELVSRWFPGAARNLLEKATDKSRQRYAATRGMPGVQVVKASQTG